MIININETWCFTGHRPDKLHGYNKYTSGNLRLKVLINHAVEYLHTEHNINNFMSGMALGWDMWAAEVVIDLRQTYPNIKLICAIPCKGHADDLKEQEKKEYDNILDKANYVHNVTGIKYFPRCLQIRNQWMVNKSIGQIAGWNGTRGGTYNCIQYANAVGKTNRIIINPKTFNVQKYLFR